LGAEPAGPAVVSSGHSVRHGLLLRNLTGRELQIATNGQVTAAVAIPPGDWGIQATLALGPHPRDSPRRRTPILPLTVTA
jgi:hypothetical protein